MTDENPEFIRWRDHYEERAGIIEFDAGKPRWEAQRLAYRDTMHQFAEANGCSNQEALERLDALGLKRPEIGGMTQPTKGN